MCFFENSGCTACTLGILERRRFFQQPLQSLFSALLSKGRCDLLHALLVVVIQPIDLKFINKFKSNSNNVNSNINFIMIIVLTTAQ